MSNVETASDLPAESEDHTAPVEPSPPVQDEAAAQDTEDPPMGGDYRSVVEQADEEGSAAMLGSSPDPDPPSPPKKKGKGGRPKGTTAKRPKGAPVLGDPKAIARIVSKAKASPKPAVVDQGLPEYCRYKVLKTWRGSIDGCITVINEGKIIDSRYYGGEGEIEKLKKAGLKLQRFYK